MLHRLPTLRLCLLTLALVVPLPSLAAQTDPIPGQVLERRASLTDSLQQYALYLPSRYDPAARWPALIVMDPRGRALHPLGLLREAAERLGYIVISSYNTASDTDQVNIPAVNAMIGDLQRRHAVDERRLYLVGFSGTARDGWNFALELKGHVAGLLGVGAGLSAGMTLTPPASGDSASFVFFGAAGTTDFNYDEVRGLDQHLDQVAIPHRTRFFTGPHSWPPAPVMHEGVEWFELMAMRRRLVPLRQAWVDSLLARERLAAEALEAAGDRYEAWRRYRGMVADYAGLAEVGAVEAAVARLGSDRTVIRTIERYRELDRAYLRFLDAVRTYVLRVRMEPTAPRLDEALRALDIRKFQRQAADSSDPVGALAAQRMLSQAFVTVASYDAREYLRRGDGARALAVLEVAEAIFPGRTHVCENRRRALTLLGRAADALALRCGG